MHNHLCNRISGSCWRAFSLLALAGVWFLSSHGAVAATRDRVLEWRPPSGNVSGYHVHLGRLSRSYDQIIDLGTVRADADGIGRSTLRLDAARRYYIAVTAYNAGGESRYSNEILVPASLCDPGLCDDGSECTADDCTANGCVHKVLPDDTVCDAGGRDGVCRVGICRASTSGTLINDRVSLVHARGNPCGSDYDELSSRCAGWLLVQDALEVDPVAIEDSAHVGTHLQSFVSNSTGTPLANLIFDLGARGAANTIVMWQYTGQKLSAQVRGYQIRTSDRLGPDRDALVGATTVATGRLTAGPLNNTGQRIGGLSLGRYVQIVGTSNYGSVDQHGLGAVAFIRQ